MAIKSDGGSSKYYDIELPEWLFERIQDRYNDTGVAFVKAEEIIEAGFDNDFSHGNLFKSHLRAFRCTQGQGKEGNTLDYEVNKILYYAERVREQARRLGD